MIPRGRGACQAGADTVLNIEKRFDCVLRIGQVATASCSVVDRGIPHGVAPERQSC